MSAKKNSKTKARPGRARKAPKREQAQPPGRAAAEPKAKKLSALGAAARVLAEEGRPMNCRELVGRMAAKGYWRSPAGRTPAATLSAALLREVSAKGDDARFKKVGRGTFALNATA